MSALNPKGLLIFLSILPQFTRTASGWPLPMQLAALGGVFIAICALFYLPLGHAASRVLGARPGIVMPGTFLLGSRYMQEFAPDVAMDRAEHTRSGLTVETGLGTLDKCVEVTETTPLESGRSTKIYCPDVGLVQDDELTLTTLDEPGAD